MSISIESRFTPPALRRGLIILPAEAEGQFVVKNAAHGTYFHVGEQESYLLTLFDGEQSAEQICAAFEDRYREALAPDDLIDFVKLAERRGLLEGNGWNTADATDVDDPADCEEGEVLDVKQRFAKQSLIHYRVPFFDPDRLLTAIEPRVRFLWTKEFFLFSAALIAGAAVCAFVNWQEWLEAIPQQISWQTVLFAWFTIFVISTLHEFAHGLTCKHYGGEVHEIGFLLLYGMPCFYCNVSDAWLFREKRKRLQVGVAGAYCDLVLWALATLVWRVVVPDSQISHLAWMLMSVCLGGCFFNFNPLVKLDGYYLLSDAMGLPNLSSRARRYWFKILNCLLWGGQRPADEPRSRFLLMYGLMSWLFISTVLCGLVFSGFGILQSTGGSWGWMSYLAPVFSLLMAVVIGRNLFSGIFAREFSRMMVKRRARSLAWGGLMIGAPLILFVYPYQDRATGTFLVRPSTRIEINALETGFLRDINVEEGSRVSPGAPVARIDIPDLEVNITKKMAEIRESEANLRRLQAGPRPEEIIEQRQRVERDAVWCELGRKDLERARNAFAEEVKRLDIKNARQEAELKFQNLSLQHATLLHSKNALSGEQFFGEKTTTEVKRLELAEAQSQKRAREAEGTTSAEAELARREKELAEQKSLLRILEAGGRPEEIEAERARLARLLEERKYLEGMQARVMLCSPVAGIITTPRLNEKNGQFVPQGTVVCVVEQLTDVVAEIAVREEDEFSVQPGQRVELRARAIPFRTFEAQVDRKAPSAVVAPGKTQATVTVYCRMSEPDAEILSGMTGYARIYQGRRPLGLVLLQRAQKYLRTEFWWW